MVLEDNFTCLIFTTGHTKDPFSLATGHRYSEDNPDHVGQEQVLLVVGHLSLLFKDLLPLFLVKYS